MSTETTAVATRSMEGLLLVRTVEEFLFAEAELLDNRQFDEWLALLTDDIRYWMPMRRNVRYGQEAVEDTREQADMNWFDESKDVLVKRVEQLKTGVHWAEEPLSRVCHLVSNVQLTTVTDSDVALKCRFIVYRNRRDAVPAPLRRCGAGRRRTLRGTRLGCVRTTSTPKLNQQLDVC